MTTLLQPNRIVVEPLRRLNPSYQRPSCPAVIRHSPGICVQVRLTM